MTSHTLPAELAFGAERCENAEPVSREHELVARALEGDGKAYAALVEEHLPVLYRIAQRACGDRALAEDAVQEALTLAYERLNRYTPGTSLRAFLAAHAVKKAQTLIRSERRRRIREESSDAPERLPGPAEMLRAERAAEQIRAVLAKMPKKRRAVAMLRLDGDMSYAEIAEAIGTTEGSARVLVHLAMKELKEELAELLATRE